MQLSEGREISLGELMLLAIFKQMLSLGRHPRTFVRVDRRNQRSLALCDRVGLTEERPDPTPIFWFSVGASCRGAPDGPARSEPRLQRSRP